MATAILILSIEIVNTINNNIGMTNL